MRCRSSFNRTRLELKQWITSQIDEILSHFQSHQIGIETVAENSALQERQRFQSHQIGIETKSKSKLPSAATTFNRTRLELKLAS